MSAAGDDATLESLPRRTRAAWTPRLSWAGRALERDVVVVEGGLGPAATAVRTGRRRVAVAALMGRSLLRTLLHP